ncbi:MAG: molybdenum ABC transporter ATP-binding protein, partial [Methylococcus sp.]
MIKARFDRKLGDFRLQIDLALPSRGVTIIFGASGSGKTTFLRCMAGLTPEARGYLAVGDQVWQDDDRGIYLPCHRRPIGYVFQDAALFPHLTVEKNLLFGLQRVAPELRWISMDQAIKLLGIGQLLKRDPCHLSGGEQQRVALARALLTSPQILLLDEPLAALDLPMKREILPYLERLRLELNIPIIYVTHALDELTRLGDHL